MKRTTATWILGAVIWAATVVFRRRQGRVAQAERGCVRSLWQQGHSATMTGVLNIPAHWRQNSHSIARSPNRGSKRPTPGDFRESPACW